MIVTTFYEALPIANLTFGKIFLLFRVIAASSQLLRALRQDKAAQIQGTLSRPACYNGE